MGITNLQDERERRRLLKNFQNAGWKLAFASKDAPPKQQFAFHFADCARNHLLTFHIGRPDFGKLRALLRTAPFDHQDVCDFLGTLFGEICESPAEQSEEQLQIFLTAASVYMVRTQTYEYAISNNETLNQFLILIYPDRSNNTPAIRPALITNEEFVSSAQVAECVREVLRVDRERHPERFGTADILEFKDPKHTDI